MPRVTVSARGFTTCEPCVAPFLCAAQDSCIKLCASCTTPMICRYGSACMIASLDLSGETRDSFQEVTR